jgi:anti-sigma regulatory factor (Ser/Thr protein kinase)
VKAAEFHLQLTAPTLHSVADGLERLEAWAMATGVRFERRRELLVVYDELATNVAKYATQACELVVRARRSAHGAVTLVVEDDGAAFDPFAREAAATDRPLEEREPGGLGVLLVRELATSVSYRRADGRNRVEVELGA